MGLERPTAWPQPPWGFMVKGDRRNTARVGDRRTVLSLRFSLFEAKPD